jgi:choline dehydrogenase-like flavoprotein
MAAGVSFFEVMQGDLRDRWGRRRPARFEIKAEATSIGRFATAGRARISGIVEAQPWASAAPLHGEIAISLLRRRTIEYRFDFTGDDEAPHELRGCKHLSLRRPVESFTRMDATLRREGVEVATGELRFDVNAVPAFLGSWWPSSTIGRVRLDRPLTDRPHAAVLGPAEHALFVALMEGAIRPGRCVPAPDETTVAAALEQLLWASSHVVQGFCAGLRWIDAMARLRTGSGLVALDPERRAAFLQTIATGEAVANLGRFASSVPVDLLLQLVTAPFRSGHYQRADYRRALGHVEWPAVAKEPEPRHFARVKEPEALDAVTEVHAEVAIVGTGAGGAPLAAALAERGVAVAILEEGRYRRRHHFVGSPAERMQSLWRYAGMNFALGTPMLLPLGRLVGGTTAINSGTCFTTPDDVLQHWRHELGFPSDFEPEAYHRYSRQVAEMLRVAPGDPKAVGAIGTVIARGADALGLSHGPLPRNAPGCPGVGQCVLGCPEGAKRSTDVSYIPAALRAGAELYVGLPMTRILKRGRRVVAVEARGVDGSGATKVVRVFAERFVLACGSLQTPVVLLENGFDLPRVGKNLSVHPAAGLVARLRETLDPWSAIPQGYAVYGYEDHGIQFEGFYLPPQMLSAALPFIGEELTAWMDDFDRLGQFGFMVRDGGDGWVRRGPSGRPIIGYRASEQTRKRLALACSVVAEVFIAAGATEVTPGIARQPVVRTRAEARALAHVETTPMDWRLLGAHPLGTCAMGGSPDSAVVDFDHRVFGTDNLHIVDGSAVPTSLGVNPQMTIMAMALRAADILGHAVGSAA